MSNRIFAAVLILSSAASVQAQKPEPKLFENYVVTNLEKLNTSLHNEFAPAISVDDQTILFVSDRNGVSKEDFWMSNRTGPADGDWSDPVALKPLNSITADGAITMTADGQTFYFGSGRETTVDNDVDIWSAHFGIDGRLKLTRLPKPVGTYNWESQPAISADGKKLFFASNRENKDKVNIYVSHLLHDGKWSEPANLGSRINASSYQASPFLSTDGKTFYFASKREGGMGGLDLYQTTWLGPTDTDWSEPIDLPAPINSEKNDFFLSIPASGKTVYFASDRTGKTRFDLWAASPPTGEPPHPYRAAGIQVGIDPNPAASLTHIRFSVPKDKSYSFSIEELNGKTIRNIGKANTPHGEMDVDLSLVAAGVYLFVTTRETGERDVQRLVVVK
jgi:Tol biopolymer transport system component